MFGGTSRIVVRRAFMCLSYVKHLLPRAGIGKVYQLTLTTESLDLPDFIWSLIQA